MFKNKIIEHFLKDHGYHEKLLVEFSKSLVENSSTLNSQYNTLRNSLLRHNNSEESMYSEYAPEDTKLQELIKTLIAQHRELIVMLDDCNQESYGQECVEKFKEFRKVLNEHIRIEEKTLYPYCDKEISKKSPTQLIDDLDVYDPIE